MPSSTAADARPPSGDEGKILYRSPLDAKGYTILHNAVLLDPRLSDGAKVTYLVLLFHARQDDHCFPGQAKLCEERGIKERALRGHLAELEEIRLITRERRGKKLTNLYWIEPLETAYPTRRGASAGMPAGTPVGLPEVPRLPSLPPGNGANEAVQSDRRIFAGHRSDRQKSAGHRGGDRQKTAGPLIGSFEEDAVLFKRETETLNVPEGVDKNMPSGAVQRVVQLTGDSRSIRRFKQLYDICLANRCTDVWSDAMRSTERRLRRIDVEELDRPGAYFCTALITLLLERGISVPTGTREERTGVRGLIEQSLGRGGEEDE